MSDLKFDTAAFIKAANAYVELADNMEALKRELEDDIRHLVRTEWVSPASRAFMDQYQELWAKNVMEYVTFLRYLNTLMRSAGTEYDALAQRIEQIKFPEYR